MAEIEPITRQFVVTAGEQRTTPVVLTPAAPVIEAMVARPSLGPVFGFLTVPVKALVPDTVPVSFTVGSPVSSFGGRKPARASSGRSPVGCDQRTRRFECSNRGLLIGNRSGIILDQ